MPELVYPPLASLENRPATTLYTRVAAASVVTKSCLALGPLGVYPECIFDELTFRRRVEMNLVAIGSLLKNGVSRADAGQKYFHVLNIWGLGYHHWLTEIAPKLIIFENSLRTGVFLLPSSAPPFVFEFLSLIKVSNFLLYEGNLFVRDLTIISNPNSGHFNKEHLDPVVDRLLRGCGAEFRGAGERLYITRRNSRGRKIQNDVEVSDFLGSVGFQTVDLDKMGFAEQVRIFSNCELLVSIHGAGLTNLIFMRENSQVVEIYPKGFSLKDYFNACYYRLCSVLGVHHRYFFAERVNPSSKFDLHNDDVVVDIEQLSIQISKLI